MKRSPVTDVNTLKTHKEARIFCLPQPLFVCGFRQAVSDAGRSRGRWNTVKSSADATGKRDDPGIFQAADSGKDVVYFFLASVHPVPSGRSGNIEEGMQRFSSQGFPQ